MIGLGSASERGLLQLDEIANVRALPHFGRGPQVRERADACAHIDARVREDAMIEDRDAITDVGVGQPAACVDPAALTDGRRAFQQHTGTDDRIRSDCHVGVDERRRRILERHAAEKKRVVLAIAKHACELRQIDAAVHAAQFRR